MLLEPSTPGGAGGHQMTGGRGPSSTPPTPHHKQHPTTAGGLSWAPMEGRECQVPDRGSAHSPFPFLFLSQCPSQSLAAPAPERGAVLHFFGWGRGRERGGPGIPQGDGPAPMILAPTQG